MCTWEEAPCDEREGTRLFRAIITETLRDGVEGGSRADLLMAYGAEKGSAAYVVGPEHVVGAVHDRSSSFVLSNGATMERSEVRASLSVVPDSGTGELRGLCDEARICAGPDGGHTFELDYELA